MCVHSSGASACVRCSLCASKSSYGTPSINRPSTVHQPSINRLPSTVDSEPTTKMTDNHKVTDNVQATDKDIKLFELVRSESKEPSCPVVSIEDKASLDVVKDVAPQSGEVYHAYKTRFWILGVFSFTTFTSMMVWGTFSTIPDSVHLAFGWEDGYIALLESWAPIFSVICMIPFNFMAQKYGLRVGMLLVCCLATLATGLRCITIEDKPITYLASVAAILNGMASCLILSLPPMLSSNWFPMKERATATAICIVAVQYGIAGMYISPVVVRTPDEEGTNKDEVIKDIRHLMFIHFGMAVVCLVCTLIYFPKEPPTPPSASSTVERIDYFKSIKLLINNSNVMLVVLVYTFSYSLPICWLSVMNLSFNCLDISQDDSKWIAIAACVASSLLTLVGARLTDRFYGHMKVTIMGLLLGASCFFLWFLMITEKVIEISSITQVFISVVLGISLQYATVPLLIELAVELSYPCPESVVGALISLLLDTSDGLFLLLMIIPSECYRWLSYAILASLSLPVILMFFVKEVYNRSNLDKGGTDGAGKEVTDGAETGHRGSDAPKIYEVDY